MSLDVVVSVPDGVSVAAARAIDVLHGSGSTADTLPVPIAGNGAVRETDAAPIVAVTSWEEVLDLTEAELRALYCEVRSRPPGAATMAYWSVRLGLEVTTNG